MKHKLFNKTLAILLSFMVMSGLLPSEAFAAEHNPTELTVGNIKVDVAQEGYWMTDENGVLTSSDESNYNVYYDANGTLYLNNATIAGVSSTSYGAGILFKGGDLTIDLKGDNKIIASADDSDSAGITNAYNFAYGLTLLGGGSLDIKSADTHDTTYAIFIAKNIIIDNVNITATTGKTEVSRNEAIRSEAGSIYIKNSTMNVQTPDNENAWWSRGLMAGNGLDGINITIENSVVTVNAGNVRNMGDADSSAIEANEINIKNSLVVANGQHWSLAPYERYTIDDSLVHQIVRNDNSNESCVYGNYELASDYTIGKDETLLVNKDAVLTVGKDTTLTNEGNVVNEGNIQVNVGGTYTGMQPQTNKVKYEIGWDTDSNGISDKTDFMEYGTPLVYDGQTPEKQGDAQYSYEFSGWNPAIVDGETVSASVLYSAVFTPVLNHYTITLPQEKGYNINYTGDTNIPYNGDFSFTVDFDKGYYPGENFVIKVNDAEIQSDNNGNYVISNISENKKITVEGIEYDAKAPVMNGIEDRKTYCGEIMFTVEDDNLSSVTIDGKEVIPDSDGFYTVASAVNEQTIVATDKAGNNVVYKITVNADHQWSEPKWQWSNDGKTATVVFTCENDRTHKATPKVTMTSVVKIPATCTKMGISAYTATVEFNGNIYVVVKEMTDITALGHKLVKTEMKAATCTEAGNIAYLTCATCGKHFSDAQGENEISLESTVIPATGHRYENGKCTVCEGIDPEFQAMIIAGANGTWQKGNKNTLSFTSNASFNHFIKVQVDGKELDKANYEVKEGSTTVTLKASYLETLSAGKHTLSIVSETGTATTEFTIKKVPVVHTDDPKTGITMNMMLLSVMLLVSAGVLGMVVYRKYRKQDF